MNGATPTRGPVDLGSDGYCVRELLGPDEVAALLAEFDQLGIDAEGPVYRSFINEPRQRATAVHEALSRHLSDTVDRHAPGHRIVLGTYVHKAARTGETVNYHQDWTFTDERSHRSLQWWIPLVDVDEGSGTLAVIPGSHRWTGGLRTSSQIREGPTEPWQSELSAVAAPIALRAGRGIVYDPALVHGSPPNRSPRPRPAIILVTAPTAATVVHFAETDRGLEGWRVDSSYFTTSEFESLPRSAPRMEPWAPAVSPDDFDAPLRSLLAHRRLDRARSRPARGWWARVRRVSR